MNKDKPRSSKCRHFCFPFDTHNYCPTCRESGKGDDPCVTCENPRQMCGSFTEEQMLKISQRKRYIKKQKCLTTASKDELDLLGDDVDSFTGSNADLESAADNLFTSPPHPQPLPFSSLSLKTPAKTVPPTPGTSLQQKIESNLEKSLGNTLNIHLQQQMGLFQASMLEAFQSLREELTTKKQRWIRPLFQLLNLEPHLVLLLIWTYPLRDLELPFRPRIWMWTMVQHFLHVSHLILIMHQIRILMHPRNLLRRSQINLKNTQSHSRHEVEPRSASDQFNNESDEPRIPSTKPEKHADKSKHKARSRYVSSSSEEDQSSASRHRSTEPSGALSDQDQPQYDPDPPLL